MAGTTLALTVFDRQLTRIDELLRSSKVEPLFLRLRVEQLKVDGCDPFFAMVKDCRYTALLITRMRILF